MFASKNWFFPDLYNNCLNSYSFASTSPITKGDRKNLFSYLKNSSDRTLMNGQDNVLLSILILICAIILLYIEMIIKFALLSFKLCEKKECR